jgi:FHS family L-fucose permease-like MFS transporter
MVMAISGGAIVPLIMGKVSDSTNILVGFVVPLACLLYISFASFITMKKAPAPQQ